MPIYRLLQARNSDDPVKGEEHASFAARLGVPIESILPFDLLEEGCTADAICEGVDAVLVGGSGQYSIYDTDPWLKPFIDALGELADRQVPMFASCFGFQGLVVALGGSVEKDEANAEVGTFSLQCTQAGTNDPLFDQMPSSFMAQLGHKDRATVLPSDVVVLASSSRCPYQAFRLGENIYATQFHPELSQDENRFRFSRYFDEYAAAFGKEEAQHMLNGFLPSPHADQLLSRFQELPWNS